MVARCISGGLVSDQGLAVDASLIEADANRQNSTKIGVTVEEYETRLVSWPARETGELWGIGDRPQQGPNCHSPNGSKRPSTQKVLTTRCVVPNFFFEPSFYLLQLYPLKNLKERVFGEFENCDRSEY